MPRQGSGAVIEHTGTDGHVYGSLRFTAYGKRRFVSLGAITRAEAEKALRYALTDIERGRGGTRRRWRRPRSPNGCPPSTSTPRSGGCATAASCGTARRLITGGGWTTCWTTSPSVASMRSRSILSSGFRGEAGRAGAACATVDQHDGDATRCDPRDCG